MSARPNQFEQFLISFEKLRSVAGEPKRLASFYAERIVRDPSTKLAAADALHLASAKSAGAAMATLDIRLAEAAAAYGVAVVEMG